MALLIKHRDVEFGIGDRIRVTQKIKEADKERSQSFEGMLIAIRGTGMGQSFTVRRIGAHLIGIERIFPINSPNIEKVEVLKKGVYGSRHAKLYYTRNKPKKEIEIIYSRTVRKNQVAPSPGKKTGRRQSRSQASQLQK